MAAETPRATAAVPVVVLELPWLKCCLQSLLPSWLLVQPVAVVMTAAPRCRARDLGCQPSSQPGMMTTCSAGPRAASVMGGKQPKCQKTDEKKETQEVEKHPLEEGPFYSVRF